MTKVRVMNDILANKIAAGEVIEKCSSVVKELVENSIDAKSKNIIVELNEGGLSLIKVIDDGIGMEHDDAKLSLERHATSKLYNDDDLFFIDTLGFRGEAIPSIASVSELEINTCASEIGTHLIVKGGHLITDEPGSSRKGTTISVKNLFYNTPARLKYLKNASSELQSITVLIERLALTRPEISFTLTNDGRQIVKTSGSNNLLKTIHEIYGATVTSEMIEIKAYNDDFTIYGYIGKPELLKANRNHFITFVNNRVVKNNDLNRAINDGYYTYKPVDKYPIVIIKIDTDPTLIDVNIHPTKQDVKLGKLNELLELITKTIDGALKNTLIVTEAIKLDDYPVNNDFIVDEPLSVILKEEKEEYIPEVKESSKQVTFDFNDETNSTIINEEFKKLKLYPVGLCLGTYIVAENDEGIYLLDQHAAQERVNYERYFAALKAKQHFKTALLLPITLEFSASEYLKINDNREFITSLGFTIEDFGLNTLIVKEHPMFLKTGFEEEQIRQIFDLIIHMEKDFDPDKFNEHLAITLACKTSIKANYHISMEEITVLLDELVECDNPYNCPHGRPTIIKFSIYDLEKMFKRVMD